MNTTARIILGRSPGNLQSRLRLAGARALRTLLQGVAAALIGSGPATAAVLSVDYWEGVLAGVIAAGITAVASFLNNVSGFLPVDPTQKE